jgi:hypothetical protein
MKVTLVRCHVNHPTAKCYEAWLIVSIKGHQQRHLIFSSRDQDEVISFIKDFVKQIQDMKMPASIDYCFDETINDVSYRKVAEVCNSITEE